MATMEVENIFADILERAKALDPVNIRKWFDNLTVIGFDSGSLVVGCPDNATAQYLQDNCKAGFTQAAQQITGHLVTVDISVYKENKAAAEAA